MSQKVAEGLKALRLLSEHLHTDRAAQFSHRYVRKEGGGDYMVYHDPADCPTCSWLTVIEEALLERERASE